jgi:type II secretory pathway pseudopilin PulG
MKRERGFTLAEGLVALLVAVVLAAIAVTGMTWLNAGTRRTEAATAEAHAVARLQQAADRYAQARRSAWATTSDTVVPIATLVEEGVLPANWSGDLAFGPGLSPLGQAFEVRVRGRGEGSPAAVSVRAATPPDAAALARLGIRGEDGLRSHLVVVARKYRERYGAEAWLAESVDGEARVLALGPDGTPAAPTPAIGIPLPATLPAPGVLVANRFVDGADVSRTIKRPPSIWGCRIAQQNRGGAAASCPAGLTEVARLPSFACDSGSTSNRPIRAQVTSVGRVTFEQRAYIRSSDVVCGGGCDPNQPGSKGCSAVISGWLHRDAQGNPVCPWTELTPQLEAAIRVSGRPPRRAEASLGFADVYFDRRNYVVTFLENRELGRQECTTEIHENARSYRTGAPASVPDGNALCCDTSGLEYTPPTDPQPVLGGF